MATAKKLPSGSWRVNAYAGRDENGKQIRKSFTAPTKREAELMAAQYLTKKHHDDAPENMTLGQAIDKYIASKSNILSPSTIRGYRSIERNLDGDFKALPVQTLENKTVQTAINQYAMNHSPKTVRNALGLIEAALSVYQPDLRLNISAPQKVKPDLYVPTTEEVRKIRQYVRGTNYEIPTILAAFMGLRRSEIAALRWNDIDFDKQTIHIHHAVVMGDDNQWHEKTTKTPSSTRVLHMPPPVVDVLKSTSQNRDLVCPIRAATITSKFPSVAIAAGVRPFNFHCLRHYYASVMLFLNIPNKYTQQRMGHATDNMLKNVYQHLMAEKMHEADAMSDAFFEDVNTKSEHEK